jgi:hypothetical protein
MNKLFTPEDENVVIQYGGKMGKGRNFYGGIDPEV